MKMLITGGAGFIGSHLAERLLELGREVFIIDNLCTGKLANIVKIVMLDRLAMGVRMRTWTMERSTLIGSRNRYSITEISDHLSRIVVGIPLGLGNRIPILVNVSLGYYLAVPVVTAATS